MDVQTCDIKSDRLATRLLETINDFREYGHLCDFTIIIGSHRFAAHKLVLAVCSDFFRTKFTTNVGGSQQQMTLDEVKPSAMEAILKFSYTSQITLNVENVEDILIAASFLQINEIQEICSDYLISRIDRTNCLGVLRIANYYKLESLLNTSLSYCVEKFESIIGESEFETLDQDTLSLIVAHDHLNVQDEETVLQAILDWHAADRDSRTDALANLLANVRFSFMKPGKLVEISNDELIKSKAGDSIDEAKNFLLLRDYPEQRAHLNLPKFLPRYSVRRLQRIFALGGWTNDLRAIASLERYNPYEDRWQELSPMTTAKCGVGVAIMNDYLYAIGGHDSQNYLKTVERYSISTNRWVDKAKPMTQAKTSVGVATLNGYIYAIGGQYGPRLFSEQVERYDPIADTWLACTSLLQKRLGPGVTALNGLIFAAGGSDQVILDSFECYDPRENRWRKLAPMNTARKHFGCTSFAGKIYVVGGRGDTAEFDSAECYDPTTNEWTKLPSMQNARSGLGLVELDGLLYAIGGGKGDIRFNVVEAYDPIKREWTTKTPMLIERLGGGIAVYSKSSFNIPHSNLPKIPLKN